jgi:hypothetical protein
MFLKKMLFNEIFRETQGEGIEADVIFGGNYGKREDKQGNYMDPNTDTLKYQQIRRHRQYCLSAQIKIFTNLL